MTRVLQAMLIIAEGKEIRQLAIVPKGAVCSQGYE
jgi:hypothetical protein